MSRPADPPPRPPPHRAAAHRAAFLPIMGLLLLALVLGTWQRVRAMSYKQVLHHDEGVSYMAATGHQGEYHALMARKGPPYGTWSEAAEWKRLLRPEKPFVFGDIARGLRDHDIHPPLYFWLLHLFCLMFGTNLWTGILLNAAIDGLGLLAMYRLARLVLGSAAPAALTAAIWFLSPAVLLAGAVEARQYTLLGLMTILFADQLLRAVGTAERLGAWRVVGLFLVTFLGALAHYHFAIPMAAGLLYGAIALPPARLKRFTTILAIVAGACVLFLLSNPTILATLERHDAIKRPFDPAEIGPRARQVVLAVRGFAGAGAALQWTLVAILLIAVSYKIAQMLRRRTSGDIVGRPGEGRLLSRGAVLILLMMLWNGGVTALLFILAMSPEHAMGPRYLVTFWPFVAFLPALMTWTNGRRLTVATQVAAVVVLVVATFRTTQSLSVHGGLALHSSAPLMRARQVILDNPARGIWPDALWHVPDNASVLVAAPADLVAARDALDRAQRGTIYYSIPGYGVTQTTRADVLRALSMKRPYVAVGETTIGTLYEAQ